MRERGVERSRQVFIRYPGQCTFAQLQVGKLREVGLPHSQQDRRLPLRHTVCPIQGQQSVQ